MSPQQYMGIDPGATSGGLVVLTNQGAIFEACAMPDLDSLCRVAQWATDKHIKVFIEDVQPDRGWHIKSAWSFAKHIGQLHLIFPKAILVPPRTWQKVMTSQFGDKCPKRRALLAATELWPLMTWLKTPRCKKPDTGMIDAALIAEYGRRLDMKGQSN
jgi:hypothetical protein